MMFLTDNEEVGILLRLIADCDELIRSDELGEEAAFRLVSKSAIRCHDHPVNIAMHEAERKRAVEKATGTAVETVKA